MKKLTRIFALALAVFLVVLYTSTLIISFLDLPYKDGFMKASLYSCYFIPFIIWAYLMIYRFLKRHGENEAKKISESQKDMTDN